jgi:hypothetical protein
MSRRDGPVRFLPLLLALVVFFLFYPLMVEIERLRFFRFGFVMLMVLAVYSVGGGRWHLLSALALGVPAAAAQIAAFAMPGGSAPLVAILLGLVFLTFATVVVLLSVLRSGPVTGDKIAGASAVYLLLGLIWAMLYGMVAVVDPTSFRLPADLVMEARGPASEYAFIYYSFVTLTTLGYGEISHAETAGQGVDPNDLKMLSDFLRDRLVEALEEGGAYRVVEEPGEGVAHARVAITEVVPIDPKKNTGTKVAGMALGVGLLVPRVDMGRASIEAEILDSLSGERLVAVVATKEPRRMGGVVKGSKEWGDVKAAFKSWAKNFRKKLDRAHSD